MIRFILIALYLFKTDWAFSDQEWRLIPDKVLDSQSYEKLQLKWPTIRNDLELSELLKEISRVGTFKKLVATEDQGKLIIAAIKAYRIKKISVHSTSRESKRSIKTLLNIYRGQVDSLEVRKRMENDSLEYLHEIGYLKANISIKDYPIDTAHTKVILTIEEDYPCLIRDIQYEFTLPEDVDFPVSVGDVCDKTKLDTAIRTLKEDLILEGFNQIKILSPELRFDPISNSALVFIKGSIKEKIKSKVISKHANLPLVKAIIGDRLHTLDNTITDPNTMSTEITKKFRADGYQDVKVSPPKETNPVEDEILYTFNVDSGPRYRIAEIQIDGISAISKKQAIDIMGLYPSFGNAPILTDSIIRSAMDKLSSYYAESGFWESKIYYPKIQKVPVNNIANLTFSISEGKQRVLESMLIRGNRSFSEKDLLASFDSSIGSPLPWKSIVDFQQDLQSRYRDIGYLYSKIKIDLIQNRRFRSVQTRISVTIQEGPRVKIGKINIQGLNKTQQYVVERELQFKEGDWYSPESIDASRQALIDLGLFNSITIAATDSSDFSKEKLTIPYSISVRESKPGQVSFGPGWSLQDGGRFSLDSSYNNIEGTGRQAYFNASYSEEINQEPIDDKRLLGYNLGLGYIEPYFLNLPASGILSLSQGAEANGNQWEESQSVQTALSHKHWIGSQKLKAELFTLYKVTQEEAPADVSTLLNTDEIQIREAGLRAVWDIRNNVAWPTKGMVLSAETSWADLVFGGDTKFFHWLLKSSNYLHVDSNLVFASRLSLESFSNVIRQGVDLDILPSSERIQSGGSESNRGFRQGSLGPVVRYTKDDGSTEEIQIGGSQAFSLTLELRYKVSESFGMSSFVDISNTFLTAIEADLLTSSLNNSTLSDAVLLDNFDYPLEALLQDPGTIWRDNYISYGIGGSYLTPLGSINITYGFPLDRCPGNRTCQVPRGNQQYKKIRGGQLQINVGTNF